MLPQSLVFITVNNTIPHFPGNPVFSVCSKAAWRTIGLTLWFLTDVNNSSCEEPQSLVHRVQGSHFTGAYSLEDFLNCTGNTLEVSGTVPESKSEMGASLQSLLA